jgi:hypothetical protein
MTRSLIVAIGLLLVLSGISGCGENPEPRKSSEPSIGSSSTSHKETEPEIGQPLSDNTPFGSPPTWVFQAQGGWNIDLMDGSTSQMTQTATGCHLTLQARLLKSAKDDDEAASRAEIKRLVAEVEQQFGDFSIVEERPLVLSTLPTSKDPNTGIEFVRTKVDYEHATAPTDWTVVLAARSFVVDQVTLVLGYSCPRDRMGGRTQVDALLARTARINSQ